MQPILSSDPTYARLNSRQRLFQPHNSTLQTSIRDLSDSSLDNIGEKLNFLIDRGIANFPLPAHGHTLKRWQTLATLAGHDLSLIKLFEAHTDAIAIMHEIASLDLPSDTSWGVWCAEIPSVKLEAVECHLPDLDELQTMGLTHSVKLEGTKSWCSGASNLSHALITATNFNKERILVAISLDQPAVRITTTGWDAIGMAECNSVDVEMEGAIGYQVGVPNSYLERAGFWQGGAGIAACWYGAAAELGRITASYILNSEGKSDPHKLAHLGEISVALDSAACVLREVAHYIDANPSSNCISKAMHARLAVEAAADKVLYHSGRALGANAFCRNPKFAKLHSDLTVFLKQSHAERDLAQLAQDLRFNNPTFGTTQLWEL